MIRIDAVWMAVAPPDMRAGMETALARIITVFGSAQPHHAYLFANRRANRMKVLVHDGIGIWLASRRLHQECFARSAGTGTTVALTQATRCVGGRLAMASYWPGRRHYGDLADAGRGGCKPVPAVAGFGSMMAATPALDHLDA